MFRPSISRGRPAFGCADSFDRRDMRHPLDRFEHRRRPDAAVQPDDLRAEALERRHERLRRRAVEAVAILFGGDLRDDRQIADAPHGANRGADLVHVAERLEHEQVDAPFEQRARLLTEELLRLVDAGLAPRLDADAERADRAGDIDLVARRVPRQLRSLQVDRVHLVGQPERAELDPVRAERVRLDHVGPGADVGVVHLADQIRFLDVQFVERAVQENALRVQHRPHRAVADEDALVDVRRERWVSP